MDSIRSYRELEKIIEKNKRYYLLLHKGSSEVSKCALKNFAKAVQESERPVGTGEADVSLVTDIHQKFEIDTAPTLLIFEQNNLSNTVKGCMDQKYYQALLADELFVLSSNKETGEKTKNVILYTTPSCSWCTKIKQHFKANNIKYREVDVAANPAMAEEMKRKSGQMGVPQTEIDGRMIVGFDRPKIDQLLEIA